MVGVVSVKLSLVKNSMYPYIIQQTKRIHFERLIKMDSTFEIDYLALKKFDRFSLCVVP